MASKTVGMVFHCDPVDIDHIIQQLKQQYDIRVIAVKESWDKIWLKNGDAP